MRRTTLLTYLAGITLLMFATTGCIVVASKTDGHSHRDDGSDSCCRQVRVCQTVCDDKGCYDSCQTETRCPDECSRTCSGDLDCPKGTVCTDGVCTARDYQRTGTGGLCQSCETAYDCAEPDSRCVRLYFDRTPSGGPKVCATDCESALDCPLGFDCVDRPDTPNVCVPDEELGSTDRVCPDDMPDGVECFSAENCDAGESCIDNKCVAPSGQCTDDRDCGVGAKCRNFQCVDASEPECLDRNDCRSGEICVDGSCEARNTGGTCVRNDDCEGDAVCVDGDCLARCQDRSDCNTASEICRQGLCQPIECRFNADCGSQEVCIDARCRPRCSRDADCGQGYLCSEVGNYCKRDPTVQCRSDAECLTGEVCSDGSCTTICNCNQQCPQGEVCDRSATEADNTGLCEPSEEESTDPECRNACDCPSGQDCVDGTCQ